MGSSPLARGTPLCSLPNRWGRGLIPARAGNTARSLPCRYAKWAHPRSRGEHVTFTDGTAHRTGSSPLARGTPETVTLAPLCGGLIPARAGNTVCLHSRHYRPRAHPRSRGEHRVGGDPLLRLRGSSPLARGTQNLLPFTLDFCGLIPARAGNT